MIDSGSVHFQGVFGRRYSIGLPEVLEFIFGPDVVASIVEYGEIVHAQIVDLFSHFHELIHEVKSYFLNSCVPIFEQMRVDIVSVASFENILQIIGVRLKLRSVACLSAYRHNADAVALLLRW